MAPGAAAHYVVLSLAAGAAAEAARAFFGNAAGLARSVARRAPRGRAEPGGGHWRQGLGPPVRPTAPRAARVQGPAGRQARRPRPRATSCCTCVPRRWTCASSWSAGHGGAGRRGAAGGRGARFPLLRRTGHDRFCRRRREPRRPRSLGRHPDRRRKPRFRWRQLRYRAEVPARHGGLEAAVHRRAGARDRPHQGRQRGAGRRREAQQLARGAERGGGRGGQRVPAILRGNLSFRQRLARRVRHLFHWLRRARPSPS